MNKQRIYNFIPIAFLSLIFASVFFPGMMSPDSKAIYNQALAHSYSDHHPPLMAYMWHYLNYLHKGPALMYLFNMLLLWAGIYILYNQIFKNTKYLKYACLLIPFLPQIMVYSGWIWKDIIFSFGYGLLCMYLANKMLRSEKISWLLSVLFFTALFYFTSVKYQAQFVSPIMILWFFYVQNACKFKPKMFLAFIITSIVFIFGINNINHFLVTERGSGSNHSWQYVKIYDLGGMSVYSNTILMPSTFFTRPGVTLEDIHKKYILGGWDPLVVEPDSPFRDTRNEQERELLLKAWHDAVRDHPFRYLQHRLSIWTDGMILSSPGKMYLQKKLASRPQLAKILVPLATFTALIYLMPFIFASLFIAIKSLKDRAVAKYATVTLFLLSIGFTMLGVLVFKTLNSDPRYVYVVVYLFMLSVPFTVHCLCKSKKWDI